MARRCRFALAQEEANVSRYDGRSENHPCGRQPHL